MLLEALVDLEVAVNPYDFANPVSDSKRLYGRESQLSEIRYYLEHARQASRSINLAFIGDRAAGKTSLMNVAEIEAKNRDFCTVRIDLDEADSQNASVFFFKIFDGLIHSAMKEGAFGGFTGGTYQAYMDMLSGLPVTEDTRLFRPFLFPIYYSNCIKTNNFTTPVSDGAISHDLGLIASELGKPIVIFFDESNVLAQSKTLLEKLRNTFMNLRGYMLVLAGTPEMFPVMDDVFSPIIRQFKRVKVGAFSKVDETGECIRRPLLEYKLDIEVSDPTVKEIHELSGGRPYEIQLICHLLFRRVQKNQFRRMELDVRALEDLRIELAESQNMGNRPIISQMASLTDIDLQALAALTACNGTATLETLDRLHRLTGDPIVFNLETLTVALKLFVDRGILSDISGTVSFKGDYFDRLYTKYFAREKGVILTLDNRSLSEALTDELRFKLIRGAGFLMRVPLELPRQLSAFNARLFEDNADISKLFAQGPGFLEESYYKQIAMRSRTSYQVMLFFCALETSKIQMIPDPDFEDIETDPDHVAPVVRQLSDRAVELGGEFRHDVINVDVVPLDRLKQAVVRSQDSSVKERLAQGHLDRGQGSYMKGDAESALLHLRLSVEYFDLKNFQQPNNLGYVLMACGEWAEAEMLLKRARELAKTLQDQALGSYNLACLELRNGNIATALGLIYEAEQFALDLDEEDDSMGYLLSPTGTPEIVTFEEGKEVGLRGQISHFAHFLASREVIPQ